MSNTDNNIHSEIQKNTEIDFLIKSNINLFKFSNLKSRAKLELSQYNSFNYNLSGKNQNEINYSSKNHTIKGKNCRYLNNINSEYPSSKLSNEVFKNEFMNNYEESYAHYCGLNKSQFIEIYINNKYIPNINELGEINISIKSIFEILKTYSASKSAKLYRNVLKRKKIKKNAKIKFSNIIQNKYKKIFRIFQTEKSKQINKINLEKEKSKLNENSKNDNNYTKNKIKNNIQNIQSLTNIEFNKKNEQNLIENQKSKTLFNIKKNLKNISIPEPSNKNLNLLGEKSNSFFNKDNILIKTDLDSNNNNHLLINGINSSNDNLQILTSNNKQNNSPFLLLHPNLQTSNNNIFNFSSNIIRNFDNNDNNDNNIQNPNINEIHGKQLFFQFNNYGINNFQNNYLNNNSPMIKQVLSPINFSPCLGNNILSPNSCLFLKSNISSPFFLSSSPFIFNNELNDKFTFNNANICPFYFGNNNIEGDNNNNDNINLSK